MFEVEIKFTTSASFRLDTDNSKIREDIRER